MKNLRKILIIVFTAIIIVVLVKVGFSIKEKYFFEDMTDKSLEIMNVKEPFSYEIIEKVLKKNQDWSDINNYLSDEFKNKYNEKDGFLVDVNVKDAYLDMEYVGEEYRINLLPFIVETTDGLKYRYYIHLIGSYYAQNYEIEDCVLIINDEVDDNINMQVGLKFTENTSGRLLYDLMFMNNGEAGLSKNFLKKHPNFKCLFDTGGLPLEHERYDGLKIKKFQYKYAGDLDFANKVYKNFSILDVYRSLICYYDVYFKLDDNGYLDDYRMELVKTENDDGSGDHYKDAPTYATNISILAGKNRDWTDLPITQKFRDKFNQADGIFGKLDVEYLEFLCNTRGLVKYPVKVYYKNGTFEYYGLEFVISSTYTIDDVIIKKIDVDTSKKYTFDDLMDLF